MVVVLDNKENMVIRNSSPFHLRERDFDETSLKGARILSERIPVAAGVYNTTYFVIIPHRGLIKSDKKAIQLEKTDRGEKRQRLEDDHQLESRPEHQHAPVTRVVTPPTLEPRPLADQPLEQGEGASDQKPPYTYTDLITLALKEKVALTVSGIYQWITERYPYFKAEDDRWKNSVRHNLSMNPHFRKGSKSKNGAGHNWVLADEYQDALKCQFAPVKVISTEDEAAAAVRSILATPPGGLSAPPGGLSAPSGGVAAPQGGEEAGLDKESVVKRAWSSILSGEDGGVAKEGGSRLPRPALPDPVLQKSAEDILAGVKRQAKVEVQYLVQDKENDSWRPSLGPPCKKPLLVMEDPSVAHMSVLPVHNGLDLSSPPLHLVPHPAIVPHSVPSHQAHHTMGHPSHQVTSVPFCPIDQIPELDVPVYSYQYSDYANIDYNDVDGLEKALGIDFQGVVQRELLAK